MSEGGEIAEIVSGVESPADVLKAARRLAPLIEDRPVVAVLASFTAELMAPYLAVEAARAGFPLRMWAGPFAQLEQQVLEDGSELWAAIPDVVVMMVRVIDVDRHLVDEAPGGRPAARLGALRERMVGLARAARKRSEAPILVANFALEGPLPLFDGSEPDGVGHLIAAENRMLARDVQEITDAHVFDYAACVAEVGAARFVDRKLWAMARAVGSAEAHSALGRRLALSVRAVLRPTHKCVVVDLDNTLWGGVVGDDGVGGLKLGEDGVGALFKDVQSVLMGMRRRGLLLAVASKNDESTALDAIATHPEMLVRPEHLAALAVSWGPKSDGLRQIAHKLNIGLDSLVFVDDSPVERAEMRMALPMVHVVELPPDPAGFADALRRFPGLEAPRLSAEDRGRAAMVAGDAAREKLSSSAPSLNEFLCSLAMEAEVGLADARTLGRIHQLIQKTNQFNLTTRRYSLDEVGRLAALRDGAVCWLRLADRFGDLGLVCVGILRDAGGMVWEIDTLLMSCRVMGRRVEEAFVAFLGEIARARGARRLRGVYVPTAKSAPVAELYPRLGFAQVGERVWEHDADGVVWPIVIARKEAG